jgi:Spy/CpxP family protein refolding chaperone
VTRALAGAAAAPPARHAGGLRGIDLTDAQREQVRTIMQNHQAEFQQAATRLREAHRALADATQAESLNEQAVRERSAAVGSAMGEDAILRAKVRAEVMGMPARATRPASAPPAVRSPRGREKSSTQVS